MSENHEVDGSSPSALLAKGMSGHEPAQLSADLARLRALLERQDLDGARAWVHHMQQQWPDSDGVQHFSRILARPTVVPRGEQLRKSRSREYRWLRDDAGEYPGCWLAVLGADLIAADPDFSVVLAAVKKLQRPDEVLLHFQPRPSP